MSLKVKTIFLLIGVFILSGCYQFESIQQPDTAEINSSFDLSVSILIPEEAGNSYQKSTYSILLPSDWQSEDSLLFSGTLSGVYHLSDSLSDFVESLDPAPTGYTWWTYLARDTIPTLSFEGGRISFSQAIQTGATPGLYNIDYRLGYPDHPRYFCHEDNDNPIWLGEDVGPIAADVYVNPNGNDENSGLSPEEALRTIAVALWRIDSDSLNARNIILAGGLYSPASNGEHFPIIMKDHISLIGESKNSTIIDAEQQNTAIFVGDCAAVMISNLSITGGKALMESTEFSHTGGGIHSHHSNIRLEDVALYGNSAGNGGGLYFRTSNARIQNVTLIDNSANSRGGAVRALDSDLVFYRVTMAGNTAALGAGMNLYNTDCVLTNSTLGANAASDIAGGIYLIHKSKLQMVNSIVWDNFPNEIATINDGFPNALMLGYSNTAPLNQLIIDPSDTLIARLGNLDSDPLFVDTWLGDLSLQPTSPCIDAGVNLFVWGPDTLVNIADSHYNGIAPDMGALEFGTTPVGLNAVDLIPDRCMLNQNYPNPFNPTTTISYDLPERSSVQLVVFDIRGQELITLQNTEQAPGSYTVDWQGIDQWGDPVSTGVYLCRLEVNNPASGGAGTFSQTIKMLMIK